MRDAVQRTAAAAGGSVKHVRDLPHAVEGAHAVYACPWGAPFLTGCTSDEEELRSRRPDRRITLGLPTSAPEARFPHAMPLRRNVEADDAVVDSPRSLVLDQAENRLHIQRALFSAVLG